MERKRLWGMLLACLLFLPSMALAQVTASLAGTVQDTSGAVIPGVAVTVKNLETAVVRTVTTDQSGYYRALSLPVGRYEVSAEKMGFKTQVRMGINLVVGQEAVVDLNLEVGEVQQEVTVTAEAPIVNTTTASTSGLVGEQQVKDLPLNGRSFDNLITLNPGTNNVTALKSGAAGIGQGSLFNVSGRRGVENLFLLNGIEYTGASDFDTAPGGASGQLLGIDAVREFNVQSKTAGAEYGKRSGGQVSIVTLSGTNQFHGTAFDFLRNSTLDARNFFDQTKPAFRRNNFGGSAGGPIRKDKTFIFGNYEGYRQSLTTTALVFVPDDNARKGFLPIGPGGALVNVGVAPGMAAYFAIYPPQNGPELGGGIAESFYPANSPVREDFGTIRLDHIFSEKDWLSAAYTIDDGNSVHPWGDPLSGSTYTIRAQVSSLEETHIFSPTILNTARVGFSRGEFLSRTVPLVPLPPSLSLIEGKPMGQVSVGGGTVGLGSLSTFGTQSELVPAFRNLFTYSDSLQVIRGKHLINVGAWFQRLQVYQPSELSLYGAVVFADLNSLLQGKASTFSGSPSGSMVYSHQWEGAWYVQDTIKLQRNLTLNLGLRHEFTNGWNLRPERPIRYTFGPDGAIQTNPVIGTELFTKNNAKWLFGPRVGLAWDPFGKGKTSVHAGFGTYHNLMDDLGFILPFKNFLFQNVQFPMQVRAGTVIPPGGAPAPSGVPAEAKTPTVQQWSFTVEQQLTASTALTIGYVGSHGIHAMSSADANPTRSVICSASLGNCPAGLADGTKFFPLGSPKMNPNLGSATRFWWPMINSSYNSLQVDVKQTLRNGLSFRANYSYSKALDNSSASSSAFFSNCPGYVMDFRNPQRDYGAACYDVTHRFAFNGSYDLPIGTGKAFLNGLSGATGRLLSGWKLNGIVSAQGGMPFTPMVGFNVSRSGISSPVDRPSRNPNFSGSAIIGTPGKWFDPHAFILPVAGTFGNAGRNILRGPGLSEVDMSLFKDTRLGEKVNLQFRAEFFNLLNHANFGFPSLSMFTSSGAVVGSAGVINNTVTTSRQIQIGLKLIW